MLSSTIRPFSVNQGMDRIILAVCFVITLVRASPSLLKLAGFGKVNPQTGSISRPQILSPHENESKIQVIRQDPYVDEVPSCQMVIDCVEPLVISLSLQFQPAIDLRSAIDPCCCESDFEYRQLHLCLQRTSFSPLFPPAILRERPSPRETSNPAGALRCGERRSSSRGRLSRLGARFASPRLSPRRRRADALYRGSSVGVLAVRPGALYNGSSPRQQPLYLERRLQLAHCMRH